MQTADRLGEVMLVYMHNTQQAHDTRQRTADSPDMSIKYSNMYDFYNYCINDNTMRDSNTNDK